MTVGQLSHYGTIITELPNQLWGIDAKQSWTQEDGWCWIFGVIDHYNDDLPAWQSTKKGNRFAALGPVRPAVKLRYGAVGQSMAYGAGLLLRSVYGPQYDSRSLDEKPATLTTSC